MRAVLDNLGITDENAGAFDGEWRGGGEVIEKHSPIDGSLLARVRTASDEDYERVISRAQEAFAKWRVTPAPVRGETVRQLGNALREAKSDLGKLVTALVRELVYQLARVTDDVGLETVAKSHRRRGSLRTSARPGRGLNPPG